MTASHSSINNVSQNVHIQSVQAVRKSTLLQAISFYWHTVRVIILWPIFLVWGFNWDVMARRDGIHKADDEDDEAVLNKT